MRTREAPGGGESGDGGFWLARFSIRTRLLALLISALTGLALFGFVIANTRQQDAAEAAEVSHLIELSVTTGRVVDEIQRERAASALFIASSGGEFLQELKNQYRVTDAAVAEMKTFVANNQAAFPAEVLAPAREVLDDMDQLAASRSSVRLLSDRSVPVLDWYTAKNNTLIGGVASYNRSVSNADLRGGLAAYVELMNASEVASLERALLAGAFARDAYEPGELMEAAGLIGARATHLRSFGDHASDDVREFFEVRKATPVIVDLHALENVAMSMPQGGFGQDPTAWFETMSAGMDLIGEVEDHQVAQLKIAASNIQGDAETAFRVAVGAAVIFALIPLTLGFRILRSLRQQFGVLTDQTSAVASGRFDVEPLKVRSQDEVGQLTGAFNAMAATLRNMADHMATSTNDVAQQAELASVQGVEVSTAVASVSTAVAKIDQAIQDMAEGANRASSAALDAVAVAKESSSAVAKLDASSDEIGDVINSIRVIAKQTNQLALNATIEAAKAGDAGKGFAVVANEVGELAAKTAAATDRIERQVETIRGRTSEVVDVNVRIGETIDELREIFIAIAQAVDEQSSTTASIGTSLEEAADSSQEMALSIADLAGVAKENYKQAALSAT